MFIIRQWLGRAVLDRYQRSGRRRLRQPFPPQPAKERRSDANSFRPVTTVSEREARRVKLIIRIRSRQSRERSLGNLKRSTEDGQYPANRLFENAKR
jgi:hypothetical protein